MSNVNLILSELSKKQEESITLPFSKKEVKLSKPKFKFQEDIIQLFEKYNSEQAAILSYRKYINNYISDNIGDSINILDKYFYLYNVANKLSADDKYTDIINSITELNTSNTFEHNEDGFDFKFTLDVPTVKTENSFVKFFNNKKDLKIVEYAFCDIFRFVKTITINNDDSLSINVADTDINSIYKVYTSLPVNTCSKLIDFINNNIFSKIQEAQKENDIDQDPTIFVSI